MPKRSERGVLGMRIETALERDVHLVQVPHEDSVAARRECAAEERLHDAAPLRGHVQVARIVAKTLRERGGYGCAPGLYFFTVAASMSACVKATRFISPFANIAA